jgi:integrase
MIVFGAVMGQKFNATDEADNINQRLKENQIPVAISLRGGRVRLRATLPPKPGTDHQRRTRYDLNLGIPANRDGLRRAELEARELGRKLALGGFKWADYLEPSEDQADKPLKKLTVREWVKRFKVQYVAEHKIADATWMNTWETIFRKLDGYREGSIDRLLTKVIILEAVQSTQEGTKTRKSACEKLGRLAEFAGLKLDLTKYQGDYGLSSQEPKTIPSDEAIEAEIEKITNPQWRWIYGMLATFGLRPHECWFCSFEDAETLQVSDGKTGSRICKALHPEWVDRFGLVEGDRPDVTGRVFRDYGQRTYTQFKRYGISFGPYDLRHAYCIRSSIHYRLPDVVAASYAGHSVDVHVRVYNRWITRAQYDRVYQEVVQQEQERRGKEDQRDRL